MLSESDSKSTEEMNIDCCQTKLQPTECEEVAKNDTKCSDQQKSIVSKKREPKNWDKIVKDLEEEEKNSSEDNADDLFKKLYANADEDTRRAMNKSFIESKGTTLSMDWKKVGKKFVKPYEEKSSDNDSHDSDSDEEMEGMQKFDLKNNRH